MKKLVFGAVLAALASGCISVYKNDGGNSNKKLEVAQDFIHTKYEVKNEKVKATDSGHQVLLWTFGSMADHIADASEGPRCGIVGYVKNGAYAQACSKAGCDQIVAARYKIKVDDYVVYKKATAEIEGFPATAKSVEVIENKVPAKPACGAAAGVLSFLPF